MFEKALHQEIIKFGVHIVDVGFQDSHPVATVRFNGFAQYQPQKVGTIGKSLLPIPYPIRSIFIFVQELGPELSAATIAAPWASPAPLPHRRF